MYKKINSGWLKHWDFELLDIICLEVAFLIAYIIRHRDVFPYLPHLYLRLCILLFAFDIVVVFLMNNYSGNETVNAGTGKELTIKELTELVAKVVGYTGEIKWDTTKPNGTPRKLLDVSKAEKLGWHYMTELEDGIRLAYEDFLNNPMRAER